MLGIVVRLLMMFILPSKISLLIIRSGGGY